MHEEKKKIENSGYWNLLVNSFSYVIFIFKDYALCTSLENPFPKIDAVHQSTFGVNQFHSF
jgi:hypothetical protein